jgi:hypothetical protein
VSGRLVAAQLVGRDHALAELDHALAQAVSGVPVTTFILGEAGVGKTRLIQEFTARLDGVAVWSGACPPVAGGLMPYAPIVGLLRALTADLGPDRVRELAGPAARFLALLVPEVVQDPAEAVDRVGQHAWSALPGAVLSLLDVVNPRRPANGH